MTTKATTSFPAPAQEVEVVLGWTTGLTQEIEIPVLNLFLLKGEEIKNHMGDPEAVVVAETEEREDDLVAEADQETVDVATIVVQGDLTDQSLNPVMSSEYLA